MSTARTEGKKRLRSSAERAAGARQAWALPPAGRAGNDGLSSAPPGGAGDRSADCEQEERCKQDDGVAKGVDDAVVQ